jgi:hypothetical protein
LSMYSYDHYKYNFVKHSVSNFAVFTFLGGGKGWTLEEAVNTKLLEG